MAGLVSFVLINLWPILTRLRLAVIFFLPCLPSQKLQRYSSHLMQYVTAFPELSVRQQFALFVSFFDFLADALELGFVGLREVVRQIRQPVLWKNDLFLAIGVVKVGVCV